LPTTEAILTHAVTPLEQDRFEKPGSRCPVRRSSTSASPSLPPVNRATSSPTHQAARIVWPRGRGGRAGAHPPRPTRRIPSPVPTRTHAPPLPRFHREIRASAPLVMTVAAAPDPRTVTATAHRTRGPLVGGHGRARVRRCLAKADADPSHPASPSI
jgi:hypothetical protein